MCSCDIIKLTLPWCNWQINSMHLPLISCLLPKYLFILADIYIQNSCLQLPHNRDIIIIFHEFIRIHNEAVVIQCNMLGCDEWARITMLLTLCVASLLALQSSKTVDNMDDEAKWDWDGVSRIETPVYHTLSQLHVFRIYSLQNIILVDKNTSEDSWHYINSANINPIAFVSVCFTYISFRHVAAILILHL